MNPAKCIDGAEARKFPLFWEMDRFRIRGGEGELVVRVQISGFRIGDEILFTPEGDCILSELKNLPPPP